MLTRSGQVLQGLQNKGHLDLQALSQIEDVLKERETNDADMSPASPNADVEMMNQPDATSAQKTAQKAAAHGLDKRQIEQRIEEDRERHKRQRESIWAIRRTEDAEMLKLWEETSDWGEDDDRMIAEEAEEYAKEMAMQQCPHRRAANGAQR